MSPQYENNTKEKYHIMWTVILKLGGWQGSSEIQTKEERYAYIDFCRSICMLWIVGYWHLANHSDFGNDIIFGSEITNGVLACFALFSGYLNSRIEINSFSDITKFYKRRFLKFYPLYYISCTTLFVLFVIWGYPYISSIRQLIFSYFGLSTIILPAPYTLWFITSLMLLWFMTPIVLKTTAKANLWLIFYVILVLLYHFSDGKYVHPSLINCYLFYIIGFYLRKGNFKGNSILLVINFIMMFVLFYLYELLSQPFILAFLKVTYCAAFVFFLIQMGLLLSRNGLVALIASKTAYASMCAYLFHRQIYIVLNRFFGNFSVAFAYLLVLPLMLIFSYIIQFFYDKILKIFYQYSIRS